MSLIDLVNKSYDQLTDQEKEMVAYLQNYKFSLKELTSQSFAEACFVSRSSVFRLVKKLGLDSFAELKYQLSFNKNNIINQSVGIDFGNIAQSYHVYIDQVFEKLNLAPIIDLLLNSNVLYLYGTGNEQKLEIETLRQLFTSIGKKIVIFFDKGEYDYLKEGITNQDLLILVSYKGESKEGISILRDGQLRQCKSLVFTRTSQNTMAQLADYQLYVPTESIQTPTRLTYEISITFYFIIEQLFFDYVEARRKEFESDIGRTAPK